MVTPRGRGVTIHDVPNHRQRAVRTTVGRRNGGWAAVHPARLLGAAQRAVLDRTGDGTPRS